MASREVDQRPGWWQASDLNWYPPESHPDHQLALPPPPRGYAPAGPVDGDLRSSAGADPAQPKGSRVKARHVLIVAVCVLYVISPVDLAPEAVLGPFGLPDDALAVIGAIAVYVSRFRAKDTSGS